MASRRTRSAIANPGSKFRTGGGLGLGDPWAAHRGRAPGRAPAVAQPLAVEAGAQRIGDLVGARRSREQESLAEPATQLP